MPRNQTTRKTLLPVPVFYQILLAETKNPRSRNKTKKLNIMLCNQNLIRFYVWKTLKLMNKKWKTKWFFYQPDFFFSPLACTKICICFQWWPIDLHTQMQTNMMIMNECVGSCPCSYLIYEFIFFFFIIVVVNNRIIFPRNKNQNKQKKTCHW